MAVRQKHTLATVVGAMNAAGTEDLRGVRVVPTLARVLGAGSDARQRQMMEILIAWGARGASRLDRDLDGKIDEPGAAIMDAAWPGLADVLMRPTLGPLTDRLKTLIAVDDPANPHGSSYYGAWYSYFVRDLSQPTPTFCGGGNLEGCRASLRAALDAAGDRLAAAQGPDPSQWRSDATRERITFGFLPMTARWTNRPTFQQVISFSNHRRR
jgi:hypothetical protein